MISRSTLSVSALLFSRSSGPAAAPTQTGGPNRTNTFVNGLGNSNASHEDATQWDFELVVAGTTGAPESFAISKGARLHGVSRSLRTIDGKREIESFLQLRDHFADGSRASARAVREMVAKLEEGFDLALTVDGPKGPRYTVKPGPFEIAKLSGVRWCPPRRARNPTGSRPRGTRSSFPNRSRKCSSGSDRPSGWVPPRVRKTSKRAEPRPRGCFARSRRRTTVMPLDRERYEVVYPAGGSHFSRTPPPGFLSRVLLPASLVYAGASELVRRARVRDRTKTGDAVVSPSARELGGNGKTPFAAYLVSELCAAVTVPRTRVADSGAKPRISAGPPFSFVFGGTGRFLPRGRAHTEERCAGVERNDRRRRGDGGVTVSGRAACVLEGPPPCPRGRLGALRSDDVVLDDAFQTWPVARDADIVLLDAEHPLGRANDPSRESARGSWGARPGGCDRVQRDRVRSRRGGWGDWVPALAPVGAMTASLTSTIGSAASRMDARDLAGHPVPVFGIRRRVSIARPISNAAGYSAEEFGGSAAALSSVGRPRRFEESLVRLGVAVGLAIRFPDHYRYGPQDVRRIEAVLAERRIGVLVTTEKDGRSCARSVLREPTCGSPGSTSTSSATTRSRICEKPRGLPAASA